MSAGVKYSTRYFLARVANALEAIRKDLPSSSTNVATGSLVERFKDAYKQQLTTVMAFSGAAMAPALNPGALTNSSAWEKLVVRLIPRPSNRTIGVGDVVAFNSPFNQHNPHGVMVRRVAALENHVMLSSDEESAQERIPSGHCWVLADNEALSPPDVIDSRAFGYLDMNLITGPFIQRFSSPDDCGPVANSPQAEESDAAIIEGEVDVAALAAGMPQQQQPPQPVSKQAPEQQQQPGQQQQQQQQHEE